MEKILDRAPAITASTTFVLIVISVSHEFGYFSQVGFFYQAFITATDYFINAILWLPFALLLLVTWTNYEDLIKNPPKIKWRDWNSWILPSLLVGLPILFFVFSQDGFPLVYFLLFSYIWLLIFDLVIPGKNNTSELTLALRKTLKFGLVLCAAFFTVGFMNGKAATRIISNVYSVTLKGDTSPRLLIPLRNFEKGVLIRDPAKNLIVFIKWDDIALIAKLVGDPSEPLGCRWFELNCSKQRVIP